MTEFSEKVLKKMAAQEEIFCFNHHLDNRLNESVSTTDVDLAAKRLLRFAPFLRLAFSEIRDGIIESPLIELGSLKQSLLKRRKATPEDFGRVFIKMDSHLPISGSVKARGGIYEVLCFAERVAMEAGLIDKQMTKGAELTDKQTPKTELTDKQTPKTELTDKQTPKDAGLIDGLEVKRSTLDYSVLYKDAARRVFSKYSLAVGSTGNLGLSIGIMGCKMGFRTVVHMSQDAASWKKKALRAVGAEVIEYDGDYEKAVAAGREQAASDPYCHFVDDENSLELFLGYAVAGQRLKSQLKTAKIVCDSDHPLFVYLPCGVGGAPGGITYGLKQIFGENVHCIFCEPVQAPCVTLGVLTGKKNGISALDIGLDGKTIADGLAVTRPSKLVCELAGGLIDAFCTVSDRQMLLDLQTLYSCEGIFVEPSAAAGIAALKKVLTQNFCEKKGYEKKLAKNSTHIVWATGGSMMPKRMKRELIFAKKQ